jgi:hypothetical protein
MGRVLSFPGGEPLAGTASTAIPASGEPVAVASDLVSLIANWGLSLAGCAVLVAEQPVAPCTDE